MSNTELVSSWLKAQIMRLFVSIIDTSCDLPLILRDYTLITLFTFHFGKMQKQLGIQWKSYKDRRTGTIGRRMNAKSFAWGRNVNSTVASQMCVSSCDDKCNDKMWSDMYDPVFAHTKALCVPCSWCLMLWQAVLIHTQNINLFKNTSNLFTYKCIYVSLFKWWRLWRPNMEKITSL